MGKKTAWIGIHVVALLIGRVEIYSMYPFLVAFFLAAYVEGISSASLFVALLLGVVTTLNFAAVIRYSVVIVALMLLLATIQEKHLSENRLLVGGLGGIVSLLGSGAALFISGELGEMPYIPLFEAFIVTCGTIVYQMALAGIRRSPWSLFQQNEYVVSLLSLMVTVLAGLPVTLGKLFSVLAGVCFLVVFYGAFCYGVTLGATLGTICGIVLALKTGEIAMLACMALCGLTVGVARETGKAGSMAGVVVACFFLGQLYDNVLFELPNLRGLASGIVVFLLTPKGLLYRQAYSQEPASVDMSIQKNIMEEFRSQLKEYGSAFRQLCGNFMSYNRVEVKPALAEADGYYERMLMERDVMLEQMSSLGDMISAYADGIHTGEPLQKHQEIKIKTSLWEKDIILSRMAVIDSPNGQKRLFLYASRSRGRVITAREIAGLVSKILKKRLIVDEESRSIVGQEESMIVLTEAPNFTYQTGYLCHRKQGESLCGDYSYMAPVHRQTMLLMISDGMGSGEAAFRQSEFLTESIADLVNAGFEKKRSISLMNSMMSLKYQGESFATLDLCSVDLYSGVAEFIKYGAAVTFIKRDQWIDTIMSTTLPLGTVPDVQGDVAVKKLFSEDVIFMCSDGLMECIDGEDKIKCMKEYILNLEEENPEAMAAELYRLIMNKHGQQEEALKDDATLVVFRLRDAA